MNAIAIFDAVIAIAPNADFTGDFEQ